MYDYVYWTDPQPYVFSVPTYWIAFLLDLAIRCRTLFSLCVKNGVTIQEKSKQD